MIYVTAQPRHEALLRRVVEEKVVPWLNSFGTDDSYRYAGKDFDPQQNEHAICQPEWVYEESGAEKLMMWACVGDGDDGGPMYLTVHAMRQYEMKDTGRFISSLGTDRITHPERYTYWLDEYYLDLVIQEFDTQFSVVYDRTAEENRTASG